MGALTRALDLLAGIPEPLLYLLLGGGAFLENVVPPVPADTFVVVGGLLSNRGSVAPGPAFVLILVLNASGALAVWWAGHRYGRTFFRGSVGRRLLQPRQLERLEEFYRKWGGWAIFFARFLPGLRAVVPAFAGVSHLPFWRVVPAVAVASTLWYGALFWAGWVAGQNLEMLERQLEGVNGVLLLLAVLLGGGAIFWWIRTRRPDEEPSGPSRSAGAPGSGAGSGPGSEGGDQDG